MRGKAGEQKAYDWMKDEKGDTERRKNEHRGGEEKDSILIFFLILSCFVFPLSSFSVIFSFEVDLL